MVTDFSDIEIPTTADYAAILTLWEASVRATHHFLKEEDIAFFKPLILNEYLDAVNLYCIRETGVIIGFMGLLDGKVEMLFVHPATRGKGTGKRLLQYALLHKQVTKVDVNEQNEQAIGFYQHIGFRIVGRSAVDGLGKPFPILFMEL